MSLLNMAPEIGLLLFFALSIVSLNPVRCDTKPTGVYQRGRSNTPGRGGVGRGEGRNLKSGFFLDEESDSLKPKKGFLKVRKITNLPSEACSMPRAPVLRASVQAASEINFSPVLNL